MEYSLLLSYINKSAVITNLIFASEPWMGVKYDINKWSWPCTWRSIFICRAAKPALVDTLFQLYFTSFGGRTAVI